MSQEDSLIEQWHAELEPELYALRKENAALRARVAELETMREKLDDRYVEQEARLSEAERLLRAGLMENLDKGPSPLQRVRDWEDEVRDFLNPSEDS